jgi:hypothetical protein
LIRLGQQWRNQTEPFLEAASWPDSLGLEGPSEIDDEDEDPTSGLDGFGPEPDSVLEVDDRHASFLEEEDTADDDEVERIVALVDQTECAA